MNKFIFLIFGWIVYFFLHSLLADHSVKGYLEKHVGKLFQFYRIFYSLLSIAGLLFLLFINGSIHSTQLITPSNITRYVSLMLATVGILIIKAAFKQFSFGGFLGLKNDDQDEFQSNGILNHIRHPLYLGTILIVIGFWLFSPNLSTLVSTGCVLLYLPVGIWLEERKLIMKYGDTYKEYKKKVPALFPKIKF